MTVSIFVVEDDASTRAMLVDKISRSKRHRVVGAVGSLASARRTLAKWNPDILLVDLQLPDGNGIDLISEQTLRNPGLPILVISIFGDEERVISAIGAGAQGYLLKDDDEDIILDAVDRLLRGESPISPSIAAHLIHRFRQLAPNPQNTHPLSDRELEVLQLASKGLSYRETAALMGVSVNTVGTFTKRIYTKLAVSSRAEAIFEARQMGLVLGFPSERHRSGT
ncbi:MAG: response regulator transcription factor [Pseudomonadota bacterium]